MGAIVANNGCPLAFYFHLNLYYKIDDPAPLRLVIMPLPRIPAVRDDVPPLCQSHSSIHFLNLSRIAMILTNMLRGNKGSMSRLKRPVTRIAGRGPLGAAKLGMVTVQTATSRYHWNRLVILPAPTVKSIIDARGTISATIIVSVNCNCRIERPDPAARFKSQDLTLNLLLARSPKYSPRIITWCSVPGLSNPACLGIRFVLCFALLCLPQTCFTGFVN